MTGIPLWIATSLASYGMNKGLDKVFSDKACFTNELKRTIDKTIEEYSSLINQEDIGNSFPFYKSEILIQELLKTRLFSKSGYSFNENIIQNALETNPNIIKPTSNQLIEFINTFDANIQNNEYLKKLELKEFHEEEIFNISDKVDKIILHLETSLIEEVGLLKEEYGIEIDECLEQIKELKPKSAKKRIISIQERIDNNSKHISKKTKAKLQYVKAICYESLTKQNKSYECFINAYNLNPSNSQFEEKACISYFYLEDDTYKIIITKIKQYDIYNDTIWAIKTLTNLDPVTFINNEVPKIVLSKHRFSRLVYNYFLGKKDINHTELLTALKFDRIPKKLPDTINHDNLHHWLFIINAKFSIFLFSKNIPFLSYLNKDESALYLLDLTHLFSKTIRNSELIGEIHRVTFFSIWLESEIDYKDNTLHKLKSTYDSLTKKDSFVTFLYANTLQKRDNKNEAIKIIKDFEGTITDELYSLLIFCNIDNSELNEIIYRYLEKIEKVDFILSANIANIGLSISPDNNIDFSKLLSLIDKIRFPNQHVKDLILFLFNEHNTDFVKPTIEEINTIKNNLDEQKELISLIGLLYFNNSFYLECSEVLKPIIDEEQESRELLLYIQSLNKCKTSNQLELLRQLENWRNNFTFFEEFAIAEIELRQLINDKEKIIEITTHALSESPNNETFYATYIFTLYQLKRIEKIKDELEKLKSFHFSSTYYALRIAKVLIDIDHTNIGIDIVYQKALIKEDTEARMNFFFLTSKYPDYLKEFDVVEINNYVKYKIQNQVKTILITDKSKTDPKVKNSLGKKTNETFFIETKFNSELQNAKVIRIMNKYMALADEIYEEASDPFSNLPMKPIYFNGNDLESLNKALLENFSSQYSQIKEIEKNKLNEYYNYNLTFTEIATSNFNSNYINTYYSLTSENGKGIAVLPLQYQKLNKNFKNVVLDFTSGLLFYELANQFNLKYKNLIVAKTLIDLLDLAIYEAEENKDVRMTITYENNKVVPHVFGEDFHSFNINYLSKLKEWFLSNTKAITPKERIDILRNIPQQTTNKLNLDYIIDTELLSERENNILITDDLFYRKQFKNSDNIISTEHFISLQFNNQKKTIIEYLLSKKYVGLSIDDNVLYDSYINHHKGINEKTYHYAIRNIKQKNNYSKMHIDTIISTLKKIALNQVISQETFKRDAFGYNGSNSASHSGRSVPVIPVY